MRNIEIKAKIANLKLLMENVIRLSISKERIIKQHDTFYNVPNGKMKLRKIQDEDAELIFYERPDIEGPKLSSYEKAIISKENVDGVHEVLNRALGSKGTVQKIRRLFLIGQTRVHIDSVQGLGDFVELEVVLNNEQSEKEGEEIASKVMESLGIKEKDLLSGSYINLLMNK